MTHDATGPSTTTSRVVYTCWPIGGVPCGITAMAIGALLLVDHYFEVAQEVLWGVGLIALGAAVALWNRNRDSAW